MGLKFVDPPVGPGKPPKSTQFKKGQSGNPKGRPKGSKNLVSVLQKELRKKITITENGKPKKITMIEAIGRRLVTESVKGNPKSMDQLLKMVRIMDDANEKSGDEENMVLPDHEALTRIQKRLSKLVTKEHSDAKPAPKE